MEILSKTKKKKGLSKNKKQIWETFSEEIKELNNIECVYNSDITNICEVCSSSLSQTEEGYMSCSNTQCAIIYKDIIETTA